MNKTEKENIIPLITGRSSEATVFICQTVGCIIHTYILYYVLKLHMMEPFLMYSLKP